MDGYRYGGKSFGRQGGSDSGERKLAVNVEVVFNIVHKGRERKLRTKKMMMAGRKVGKLLGLMERPKGRARRKGRKGKACKERRKESRRLQRLGKVEQCGKLLGDEEGGKKEARTKGKLSGAAKVFSPARTRSGRLFRPSTVDPPLPMDPEPGSELFRVAAEGILRDMKAANGGGEGGLSR